MKHISILIWVLLVSSLVSYLSAQKYSNEFLAIGVGARAHGMGTAVISSQQDVYASAWNPAGLSALPSSSGLEVGAMHAEWFGGIGNYDYLGITLPFSSKNQRLGVSLIRFGIDQIPNTLSLYDDDGTINYDRVSEFSAADYAFIGTWSRSYIKNKGVLRLGGNIKVVRRVIGSFADSWGFGLDLGAQLTRKDWTFAVMARDITTTFNAWSFSFSEEEKNILDINDNEIPINSVEITNPTLTLGASRYFQFTSNIGLLAETNLILTTDGKRNTLVSADPISIDPALGFEANYSKMVFLRAGVSQLQRIPDFNGEEVLNSRPSLGLGLNVGKLYVDYAYSDPGKDDGRSSYSHIVSIRLGILPRKL